MTKRISSSVRLSVDFYEFAKSQAELNHRTIAAQIEHWSKIGAEIEDEFTKKEIQILIQNKKKNQ